MRLYALVVLTAISTSVLAQNSKTWEIRVAPLSPLINNVAFGLEKRFGDVGLLLDYGFIIPLIDYNNFFPWPFDPVIEDRGHFFKVASKLYNKLPNEKRYIVLQAVKVDINNATQDLDVYNVGVGIGERIALKPFMLDYNLTIGYGTSNDLSRWYHYGFYLLSNDSNSKGGISVSADLTLSLPF